MKFADKHIESRYVGTAAEDIAPDGRINEIVVMINSNNYVVFVFYILKYLGGGHFIIERGAFHRLSAFDQNVLFAPFKVFGQKIGVCRNID